MEAINLNRPERPPIYLICEGEVVENPDPSHIATEINYTVMAPIRVAYELIDKYNDNEWVSPNGMAAITNTLFMALEKWDYLSGYMCKIESDVPSEVGLQTLKDLDFEKKLTPYQRDIYKQLKEKLMKDILEDPYKECIKKFLGQ